MTHRISALFILSAVPFIGGCASNEAPPTPAANAGAPSGASRPAAPDRPWGSPDLTSGLNVPAGQRFIFAGGQRSGFTAYATNRGAVPVTIVADLDGERREIVTLAPGERASHNFAAREAALFENPSSQDADVKVEVWGETSVGMRYVPMSK